MKSDLYQCLPLRRVGTLIGGGTPKSDAANWNGSIPFVTPPDLRPVSGGLIVSTDRFLTEEGAASGSSVVPADSVLLSIRAPIGYVARTGMRAAFNQGCRAIQPSESMGSRYLTYALVAAGPELESLGRGTTFMELSTTQMAALEVPVPQLDEQRAIVDYLDRETARIDMLIEEQQRLIEMLYERRAALIAQETGWGASRPNHWPMMRLSWLFRATGSGTTPANEDIIYGNDAEVPWVTTGELREAIILETERGVSSDVVQRYSALKVHPAGSLLIAMYGATIGRMALLGIAATSNQACCALIGPTRAEPEFVQYSLRAAKNWLLLEAAGGGQPNINQDKIRSFRIPAPALEEQRHIAAYLDKQTANIDRLIVEAKLFIELSRERRSALITAAVTGQIDVQEMA